MANNSNRKRSRDGDRLRARAIGESQVDTNPAHDPALTEEERNEMEGRNKEQAAYIGADDTDSLGDITHTDIYHGELEAGVNEDLPNDDERLEMLVELELRDEETDNPFEAIEEGYAYVPPIDPPTVPSEEGDLQGVRIASGMGLSALDEPFDADHEGEFLPDIDDVKARIRQAILADSATSQYANRIAIIVRGDTVILRGLVDDLDDSDNIVAVVEYVHGIEEVIDELDVRSL